MFFILSKTVSFLIYPFNLFIIGLVVVLIFYRKKWSKKLLLALFIFIYFFSIPFTADLFMNWLEQDKKPLAKLNDHYDAVVVLTGTANLELSDSSYTEFNDGVDRILAGIRMLKLNKANQMILSGGSANIIDTEKREANYLAKFSKKNGIDQDRIKIEPQSRNTYENAKYSTQIIRKNDFDDVLLITSAFHIKRAKGCFHRQGIKPDIYPVDFRAGPEIEWQNFWKPSINSLSTNHQVIRETVGIMAYMIMGYM